MPRLDLNWEGKPRRPTIPAGDPFFIPTFLDARMMTAEQMKEKAKLREKYAAEDRQRLAAEAEKNRAQFYRPTTEDTSGRLKGRARRLLAEQVAAVVGSDEVSIHDLHKRLPDMEMKVLRSGLRRAVTLGLLIKRKMGSRFYFIGARVRYQSKQVVTSFETVEQASPKKKPRLVPESAPTTPAKVAATGGKRISPEWRKTLSDLGKHPKGLSLQSLKDLCAKNGVGAYWGRFIDAGYIAVPEKGTFVLTPAGAAMVKE